MGREEEKQEEGKGRGVWTPAMFQTDLRHCPPTRVKYIRRINLIALINLKVDLHGALIHTTISTKKINLQ
jgi:hypothetical protein